MLPKKPSSVSPTVKRLAESYLKAMADAKPNAVEYLRQDVRVDPFIKPYPLEQGITIDECRTVAEKLLSTYWGRKGGQLVQIHKAADTPDAVTGKELCRITAADLP